MFLNISQAMLGCKICVLVSRESVNIHPWYVAYLKDADGDYFTAYGLGTLREPFCMSDQGKVSIPNLDILFGQRDGDFEMN